MSWDPNAPGPRIVVRFGRSMHERRWSRATMALLVVWLGVMLAVKHREGLGPLGAGVILLVSAIGGRLRGYWIGTVQWIVGIVLAFIGAAGFVPGWKRVHWFGIAVIVAGLFVLWRTLVPRR